jgi:uncharacterized protein (TIGR02145 family)
MKNYLISIFLLYSITLSSQLMGGFMSPTHTVTDIEGNEYKTVKIGTQIWMAENLRTATYNDGTAIPNVTDATAWSGLTSGAWCYYDNTSSYNIPYGKLYNEYTVFTNKLCPIGWHVPTESEIDTLINLMEGVETAGGHAKSTGYDYWLSPNTGATNKYGFNVVGAGYRSDNSSLAFLQINIITFLWMSSTSSAVYSFSYGNTRFYTGYSSENNGFSIRCIKD